MKKGIVLFLVFIAACLAGCSQEEQEWTLSQTYQVKDHQVCFVSPDYEWGVSSSELNLQDAVTEQKDNELDLLIEANIVYKGVKVKTHLCYGFLDDRLYMVSYQFAAGSQEEFENICSNLQKESEQIPEVENEQTGNYIQNGALWTKIGEDGSMLSIQSNPQSHVIHILISATTP